MIALKGIVLTDVVMNEMLHCVHYWRNEGLDLNMGSDLFSLRIVLSVHIIGKRGV